MAQRIENPGNFAEANALARQRGLLLNTWLRESPHDPAEVERCQQEMNKAANVEIYATLRGPLLEHWKTKRNQATARYLEGGDIEDLSEACLYATAIAGNPYDNSRGMSPMTEIHGQLVGRCWQPAREFIKKRCEDYTAWLEERKAEAEEAEKKGRHSLSGVLGEAETGAAQFLQEEIQRVRGILTQNKNRRPYLYSQGIGIDWKEPVTSDGQPAYRLR